MALSATEAAAGYIQSGSVGIEGVYSARRKYSLPDKIVALDRTFALFDFRLREAAKKVVVTDPEPKFLVREEAPIKFTLPASSGDGIETTYEGDTIKMADGQAKYLQNGDVLQCPQIFCDSDGAAYSITKFNSGYQPETMLVQSVTLSGISAGVAKIVVRRGNGYSTAALAAGTVQTILSEYTLVRMANALAAGGDAPTAKDHEPADVQNHIQFFSRTASEDEQYTQTDVYGKETLAQRLVRKRRELNREAEAALLFGRKGKHAVGGKPQRTTGGVIDFIPAAATALDGTSRFINFNGAFDPDTWNKTLEIIFRYGNPQARKWAFCGGKFYTELENALRKFLVLNDRIKRAFQINVSELESSHGILELMRHPLLTEMSTSSLEYALDCIIADPEYCDVMYLKNLDFQVRSNIQAPRSHVREDEIFGHIGLHLLHPTAHAYVYGMTESA